MGALENQCTSTQSTWDKVLISLVLQIVIEKTTSMVFRSVSSWTNESPRGCNQFGTVMYNSPKLFFVRSKIKKRTNFSKLMVN